METRYDQRIVDDELDELMRALPAIALEGAKGVGKTATATERAVTIYALDDPAQRAIAAAEPQRLIDGEPPVLLDEWQRVPELWDRVRRAVDAGAAPGQFLLAGSASPSNLGTHSGAGRIVSVRMRPFSLAERLPGQATVSLSDLLTGGTTTVSGQTAFRLSDYTAEIVRSGFPGLRELPDRALRAQLDSYALRIVDRDFPELGRQVRNPPALRRWLTAYAAASSTSTTWEKIRDAASAGHEERPAQTTVISYRDVLERLWVLDPVPAWSPSGSRIARLRAAPKHQLVDPGLAASLLGATEPGLLTGAEIGPSVPRDGTLLGALFESLVTLSVRVYAQQAEARVSHMRSYSGDHEVDLVVERDDGRVLALEVKLAQTVSDGDVRQLRWLAGKIGDDLLDAVVVTTGEYAYRRKDGIAVVPAALLGP